MLSGVVELIPDRAWLTADAFIDVKGLTAAHPKAKQEAKAMSKGTVLVTGSDATRIEVQGSGWGPTGNYLNETVVPIMALISDGYDVQLATPNGTKPHMDKASDSAVHFGGDTSATPAPRTSGLMIPR